MSKKRLGKGMDALFSDAHEEAAEQSGVQMLRLSEIEPSKGQPRKSFDEEGLAALADSIRIHGVLQPILVRPLERGGYRIIAGERRWRASRLAGLSRIPACIREMNDMETAQAALIENLLREDLNPIEEADGINGLMTRFGMTQDEVAHTLGMPRSSVTNALRLLKLDADTAETIKDGKLTPAHGRALLMVDNESERAEFREKAISENLSVRQLEKLTTQKKTPFQKVMESVQVADSYATELEISLNDSLGKKRASIKPNNDGTFTVKLKLEGHRQLKRIAETCAEFKDYEPDLDEDLNISKKENKKA